MNSYTVGFFGAMGRSPRAWVVLAKADLRGARWPGQRVVCWLRAVKEGLKWTSTSRRARRVATRRAEGASTLGGARSLYSGTVLGFFWSATMNTRSRLADPGARATLGCSLRGV